MFSQRKGTSVRVVRTATGGISFGNSLSLNSIDGADMPSSHGHRTRNCMSASGLQHNTELRGDMARYCNIIGNYCIWISATQSFPNVAMFSMGNKFCFLFCAYALDAKGSMHSVSVRLCFKFHAYDCHAGACAQCEISGIVQD